MKRKIAVVTSSRADYSHLYWPLRELERRPEVELSVIVKHPIYRLSLEERYTRSSGTASRSPHASSVC